MDDVDDGEKKQAADALVRLLDVVAALRRPVTGCDWDIKQTAKTIVPYTIEEAYEVAEAIEISDTENLKEELGDLLFNVVYHARLAEESGDFDFGAIAAAAANKMIRRHPHVFKESDDPLAIAARANLPGVWSSIKAAEKALKLSESGQTAAAPSVLDGVAVGQPALSRAVKLQKQARDAGFDWPDFSHVIAKVDEELAELKAELVDGASPDAAYEEFGDLMFALVEVAWRRGFDPETALRAANGKFTRRFHGIEAAAREQSKKLDELSYEELLGLWRSAKLST
ncbi:MAG: nucleoside triphosphate pyrophosphohydrolase [Hyphomicrobiales bacterium]|nr:nucleoside triphosphate pyrophosphohydrolase [Hyphomicrobiales bacterium]